MNDDQRIPAYDERRMHTDDESVTQPADERTRENGDGSSRQAPSGDPSKHEQRLHEDAEEFGEEGLPQITLDPPD